MSYSDAEKWIHRSGLPRKIFSTQSDVKHVLSDILLIVSFPFSALYLYDKLRQADAVLLFQASTMRRTYTCVKCTCLCGTSVQHNTDIRLILFHLGRSTVSASGATIRIFSVLLDSCPTNDHYLHWNMSASVAEVLMYAVVVQWMMSRVLGYAVT